MEKNNERSTRISVDASTAHWKWRQIPQSSNSPSPRHLHSLVHHNNNLYLFGGFGDGEKHFDDFWQYSLVKRRWKKIKSKVRPSPRHSHQAVVWKDRMILFGGISAGQTMNDLWSFDFATESWKQERILHGVWGHSMVVFADKIVIFGGADENAKVTNKLAVLDANTLEAVEVDINNVPPARQYASMVAEDNAVYLFGGLSNNKSLNDFYKMTITETNQIITESIDVPSFVPELRGASLSVLPYQSQLILFGGRTNETMSDYTYSFALGSSKWSVCSSIGPSPRYYHQTCTANRRVILFGGLGLSDGKEKAINLNDMWWFTDEVVQDSPEENVNDKFNYSPIPTEIWGLILSFMDSGNNVAGACVVSKQFYNIIKANEGLQKKLRSYKSSLHVNLPPISYHKSGSNKTALIKFVVTGLGGSGKSASVIQFIQNHFVEEYDPTIEDSYRKQYILDGTIYLLEILDTAGPEEYATLLETWYSMAHGIYAVYSITHRQSFDDLDFYVNIAKRAKKGKNFPLIIVGNKYDLESDRQVTQEEGQEFAKKYDAMWIETSAKTRHNIEEAFVMLTKAVVEADNARKKTTGNRSKKERRCSLM